jgi:hypothetical protein
MFSLSCHVNCKPFGAILGESLRSPLASMDAICYIFSTPSRRVLTNQHGPVAHPKVMEKGPLTRLPLVCGHPKTMKSQGVSTQRRKGK